MRNFQSSIIAFALLVALQTSLLAQESDFFPITENGNKKSFSTSLQVQHNLELQGLLDYGLVFNPEFDVRGNNSTLYLFRFEEIGEFNPALKPQLPANTHMQFIIDGSPSPEFAVKKTSFRNERDARHVIKFLVVIPKNFVEKISDARTVRGLLYFLGKKGRNNEKFDVKSFTMDAKTLRTLSRLYAMTK